MSSPVLVEDRPGHTRRRMATSSHRHPGILRHVWHAITGTLKAVAEGAAEARRMARLYDQLSAMSDPELQDMGIYRGDIQAVVSGKYRWARWPSPDGV